MIDINDKCDYNKILLTYETDEENCTSDGYKLLFIMITCLFYYGMLDS